MADDKEQIKNLNFSIKLQLRFCNDFKRFKIEAYSKTQGLVWYYGTSTIVGYLMPILCLYIQTVLFQTIQFSMSTQFKSQKPFCFKLFILVNKAK